MPLQKFIKENFVLVLGFALPVLMVLAFLAATALPRALAEKPQHRMLLVAEDYNARSDYAVVSACGSSGALTARPAPCTKPGKLVENPLLGMKKDLPPKRLFLYDFGTGDLREVDWQDARRLALTPDMQAPDGYALRTTSDYRHGFMAEMFVGGSSRQGLQVSRGWATFKVPAVPGSYNGYHQARFLAWVLK